MYYLSLPFRNNFVVIFSFNFLKNSKNEVENRVKSEEKSGRTKLSLGIEKMDVEKKNEGVEGDGRKWEFGTTKLVLYKVD